MKSSLPRKRSSLEIEAGREFLTHTQKEKRKRQRYSLQRAYLGALLIEAFSIQILARVRLPETLPETNAYIRNYIILAKSQRQPPETLRFHELSNVIYYNSVYHHFIVKVLNLKQFQDFFPFGA